MLDQRRALVRSDAGSRSRAPCTRPRRSRSAAIRAHAGDELHMDEIFHVRQAQRYRDGDQGGTGKRAAGPVPVGAPWALALDAARACRARPRGRARPAARRRYMLQRRAAPLRKLALAAIHRARGLPPGKSRRKRGLRQERHAQNKHSRARASARSMPAAGARYALAHPTHFFGGFLYHTDAGSVVRARRVLARCWGRGRADGRGRRAAAQPPRRLAAARASARRTRCGCVHRGRDRRRVVEAPPASAAAANDEDDELPAPRRRPRPPARAGAPPARPAVGRVRVAAAAAARPPPSSSATTARSSSATR